MKYSHKQLTVADIILRRLSGADLSQEEESCLSQWLGEKEENRLYLDRLQNSISLDDFDNTVGQFDIPAIWKRIDGSIWLRRTRKRRSRAFVAASVAAAVLVGAVVFRFSGGDDKAIVSRYAYPELTISGGETFVLDNKEHKTILEQKGVYVQENNSLSLENLHISGRSTAGNVFVSLAVPQGGDYSMTMPDGSGVRLNSRSKIRFASDFGKGTREVWLDGEGYFNVAKDENIPFIVHSGGITTRVLGTSFNVNAFAYQNSILVTLVEGSLEVGSNDGSVILEPGEQSVFDTGTGALAKHEVDTSIHTAWLEGKLYFVGYKLEDIVERLQQWYDFEMVYASDDIRRMRFSGTINKNNALNDLFVFLEETGSIRFSIEGTTVNAYKVK